MTKNIQLTDNFWLDEYYKDSENPKAAKFLFDNGTAFEAVLAYDLALDQQKMRDFINEVYHTAPDIGIINTSGYRDPELNALQNGSASKSLHTIMRAVDFKTKNKMYLKKIYNFITLTSDLDYRECFLYVTSKGIATNIHYAKKAPGFTDTRYGVYVRPPDGTKPVRFDDYVESLLPSEREAFEAGYGRNNA